MSTKKGPPVGVQNALTGPVAKKRGLPIWVLSQSLVEGDRSTTPKGSFFMKEEEWGHLRAVLMKKIERERLLCSG